jgi:hypothetical protein
MTWDAVFLAPDIQIGDQPVGVLRLLGRLECVITPDIWRVIYAPQGYTERTAQYHLHDLYKQQLVWRQRVSLQPRVPRGIEDSRQRQSRAGPSRKMAPYAWGLTPQGREYLSRVEAEPDADTLAGLHVRDRRAPKVPLAALIHDLQASWWCCGVIQEVVRCPYLRDIVAQVAYDGFEIETNKQRVDALVGLRFGTTPLPLDQRPRPGTIPWDEGFQMEKGQWWEWFALEVDRGTESVTVLFQKATTYRNRSVLRLYEEELEGDLLPVVLTPSRHRAGIIARQWQDAWDYAKGVVSPVAEAAHPQRGPLWGRYTLLRDGKVERPLLQKWTLEEWEGICGIIR